MRMCRELVLELGREHKNFDSFVSGAGRRTVHLGIRLTGGGDTHACCLRRDLPVSCSESCFLPLWSGETLRILGNQGYFPLLWFPPQC